MNSQDCACAYIYVYTFSPGPNNRYEFRLPRFVNSVDGSTALGEVSVSVQEAPGNKEDIEEVGDINDIDVRVFDIPIDDIDSADIMYAAPYVKNAGEKAKEKKKAVYYQWDLAVNDSACSRPICQYAEIVLVSATIAGGGLYVLSIRANQAQYLAEQANIKLLRNSFSVSAAETSSLDMSQRIYGQLS